MRAGPNVRKLIVHKMSFLLVPPLRGDDEGRAIAVAVAGLFRPGNLMRVCREATAWVRAALTAVKAAPDNPYGDDDELIAGVILSGIDKKKVGR
jgi:hypothetical protein